MGFTPRSLEVVFKDYAERQKIEDYRAILMKQRTEIQDERWKPQWQMSTCDEMRQPRSPTMKTLLLISDSLPETNQTMRIPG